MGAFAIVGTTFFLWRAASIRAALLFLAFVALGVASYWIKDEQRPCNNRAWFCDFMPDRGNGFVGPPEYVDPCPDDLPLTRRVFLSDAADKEVHRLIGTGVCQEAAIKNVASGWKAEFDPEYLTWWQRLFY